MDENEKLILQVIGLLQKVKKWKWRNTSALAEELSVNQVLLLKALIHEASKSNRRISYHPLPGRRKMDILWGLATADNKLNDPPPLKRTDEPDSDLLTGLDDLEPYVFISHNHQDFHHITAIKKILSNNGLNSWLFETGIEHEALIIPTVQNALKRCSGFLVYVSINSIGSSWVQKELEYLSNYGETPICFVLNGSEKGLVQLIDARKQLSEKKSMLGEYINQKSTSLHVFEQDQIRRIGGLFLNQIGDVVKNGGVLSIYPDVSDTDLNVIQPSTAIKSWADSLAAQ